jgi:hypothetical protein
LIDAVKTFRAHTPRKRPPSGCVKSNISATALI